MAVTGVGGVGSGWWRSVIVVEKGRGRGRRR
jgi:hypothetical protein